MSLSNQATIPSLHRSPSTNTHSSFLNAVYLDPGVQQSRSHEVLPAAAGSTEHLRQLSISDNDDDYEDLFGSEVRIVTGGTKRFRVRRKKGAVANASYGGVRVGASKPRRRRSTLSFPHSPSPRTPVSPRHFGPEPSITMTVPQRNPSVTSNTSSTHPHATISRLFLSLPEPSPSPRSPTRAKGGAKGDRSSGSSLHLGLGRFGSYDPIIPGPSPPSSPLPSPTKRAFIASQYARKPIPTPSSPLTPSRAPRKAAQLLGAGYTASSGGYSSSYTHAKTKKNASSALNGKHFRPLPHAALAEIERFFGDVPRKPSKPLTLKPSSNTARARSKSSAAQSVNTGAKVDERGNGERNVGEGGTVKHRGEDGSMWLDVEEEQEFAWLMSEIFAIAPQPLPNLDLGRVGSNATAKGGKDSVQVLHESEGDGDEGKWGMEAFTSVLSMPKPKGTADKKKGAFGSATRAKGSEESFLDLDTPLPHTSRRNRPFISSPASSGEGEERGIWTLRHTRSHSNPIPTPKSPRLNISSPTPALLPPPRISSKGSPVSSPAHSRSGSGYGSGSDGDLSSSPPRVKHRPPPLTLPKFKPSSKLPILTATSPDKGMAMKKSLTSPPILAQPSRPIQAQTRTKDAQAQRVIAKPTNLAGSVPMARDEPPATPFVRPRTAPKPIPRDSSIPPVPALPMSLGTTKPQGQDRVGGALSLSQMMNEEPVSFFEPVTPTTPAYPFGGRGNGAANGTSGTSGSKRGWLKRVVRRPLAGRV